MDTITIQTANWPIVMVIYPPAASVDSAKAFLDTMRALLFSHPPTERFACISDLSLVDPVKSNPKTRVTLAEGLKDLTVEIDKRGGPLMAADARIADSTLVRTIATAMEWVRSQKQPVRYFADRASALAWVKERLAADA